MSNHKTEDALFLVGGAVLGAAALYLLDPQSGSRRRRSLLETAEHGYEKARQVAGKSWGQVAGGAKDLIDRVATETEHLHHTAEAAHHQARAAAHDLAAKVTHLGGSLSHHAQDAHAAAAHGAHAVGDWVSDAANRARGWFKREERPTGFGTGTFVSSAAGCAAVGVALMYFLDPDRGGMRRLAMRDRASNFLCATSRTMRSIGRTIAEHTGDWMHGSSPIGSGYGEPRMDSEMLITRIRADLARFSPRAGEIQLMADADGTVTLTGSLPAEDIDHVLTVIHRVPGVNHVINRLNTGAGADATAIDPGS